MSSPALPVIQKEPSSCPQNALPFLFLISPTVPFYSVEGHNSENNQAELGGWGRGIINTVTS